MSHAGPNTRIVNKERTNSHLNLLLGAENHRGRWYRPANQQLDRQRDRGTASDDTPRKSTLLTPKGSGRDFLPNRLKPPHLFHVSSQGYAAEKCVYYTRALNAFCFRLTSSAALTGVEITGKTVTFFQSHPLPPGVGGEGNCSLPNPSTIAYLFVFAPGASLAFLFF